VELLWSWCSHVTPYCRDTSWSCWESVPYCFSLVAGLGGTYRFLCSKCLEAMWSQCLQIFLESPCLTFREWEVLFPLSSTGNSSTRATYTDERFLGPPTFLLLSAPFEFIFAFNLAWLGQRGGVRVVGLFCTFLYFPNSRPLANFHSNSCD
jgi:hypothetical protein